MSDDAGASVVGVNYFDHQFLRQPDFRAASDHHVDRARQHNRLLHRAGVVGGLAVTVDGGPTRVLISPGSALDRSGREVVLSGTLDAEAPPRVVVQVGAALDREVAAGDSVAGTRVELGEAGLRIDLAGLTAGTRAFVTIRQEPKPIRPTQDLGFSLDDPKPTRTAERPVITVAAAAPPDGAANLLLAALNVGSGGALTVNTGGRIDASATLAPGSVTAREIADGAVTETKLATGAVSTRALADGSVTEPKLATGGVSARALAAGAVTNAAIASDAVASANLRTDAVSTTKLQNGAVSTSKIRDAAVTAAKLGPDVLAAAIAGYCSFDTRSGVQRAGVNITATRLDAGVSMYETSGDAGEIGAVFVFAYAEGRIVTPVLAEGSALAVNVVVRDKTINVETRLPASTALVDGLVNVLVLRATPVRV